MEPQEPTIQISQESGATIPPGAKIDRDFKKSVKRRFDKIDALLFAIVASVVVSVIAIVISVLGIFIDQLRYNNAAYSDYAEKEQANTVLLQQMQTLMKQDESNIQSQQKVIDSLKK